MLLTTIGVAGAADRTRVRRCWRWLQDRALKTKTRGASVGLDPEPQRLQDVSYRALAIGFSIYTLGLLAGILWSYRTTAGLMDLRAKQIGADRRLDPLRDRAAGVHQRHLSRRAAPIVIGACAFVAIVVAIWGFIMCEEADGQMAGSWSSSEAVVCTSDTRSHWPRGADAADPVGVNHRTAPVDVRERLERERRWTRLDRFARSTASTARRCSRPATASKRSSPRPTEDVIEPIVDWLAQRAGTARAELEKHLYILRHGDVVKHLFRVASGLDSMIVGEPQIGGQVRAAFLASRERGALDSLLSQVFEQTMRVAKTRPHRHRHRRARGLRSVRRGRAGEEDLRRSPRPAGPAPRRGRDGRADGRASVSVRTGADLRRQPLARARRRAGASASTGRRCSSTASSRTSRRATSSSPRPPRRISSSSRDHVAARAGHAQAAATSSSSTSPCRATSIRPSPNIDGAYLYNIDDLQQVADANRELRMQKAQRGRGDRGARGRRLPQAPRRAGRRADDPRAAADGSKTIRAARAGEVPAQDRTDDAPSSARRSRCSRRSWSTRSSTTRSCSSRKRPRSRRSASRCGRRSGRSSACDER